ncbi:hypothetical protein MAR_001691, partial [Mya arenaria]
MELNVKRRRNKKWNAEEMCAVADHVSDNYATLFGSFDSSNEITKTEKNSIWQSVTEIVNSMGNCRDRDEVYRKWVDMKSLTKKKLVEQVKDRNLTACVEAPPVKRKMEVKRK